MLPESVLQVFRDWQQFSLSFDQGSTVIYFPLSFESTVADWSKACDLTLGQHTGRYLNRIFGIAAHNSEWQIQLQEDNRLHSLCNFISEQMDRRGPMQIEGGRIPSMPITHERMFKTLRAKLNARGVSLGDAGPSAGLEPYVTRHFEEILNTVNELSPGAMPRADFRWKEANPVAICISFTVIYLLFQCFYRFSASVPGSVMLTILICVLVIKCWDKYHTQRYFADFETLGDLTRLMVMHRNRLNESLALCPPIHSVSPGGT